MQKVLQLEVKVALEALELSELKTRSKDNMANDMTKEELLKSDELDNAISEGAECKKDIMTSYRTQNKQNFSRFYEVMLEANEEVKKILETKKKNRSDADNHVLESFKKNTRTMYNQVQALAVDEHLEDGKKTRVEKIVEKIIPVIDILRYIGRDELEKEFNKRGMTLTSIEKLEDKYPALDNDDKRKVMKDIFDAAVSARQKIIDCNEYINNDLFTSKVPVGLQYDKSTNNVGFKTGDWRKLVDAKAKLIMASSDEAKEKAEEKLEHIAAEKQFEAARAELVRDKLIDLK